MPSRHSSRWILVGALVAAPLAAQDRTYTNGGDSTSVLTRETYVRPSPEIERLVLAPRHLNVTLTNQSPARRYFLKRHSDGMPTIQLFGKPWYNLAGFQVDYKANRARTLTTQSWTSRRMVTRRGVFRTSVKKRRHGPGAQCRRARFRTSLSAAKTSHQEAGSPPGPVALSRPYS